MESFQKPDGKIHPISSTNLFEILKYNDELPEDSFMIVSPEKIVERYEIWKQYLPRVKPFYAVKCNPDPMLLKTMIALGLGFDCASENELKTVIQLGAPPQNIIFANPTKQRSHIKKAGEYGVLKTTFDNKAEIKKIKDICPQAELVIRLRYDAKQAIRSIGLKYGAGFGDAVELLVSAKRLGMNVSGLAFHLGTGIKDFEMFGEAIKAASVFFQVAKQVGHDFKFLDIGGGFPGTFDEGGPSMDKFGKTIGDAIDKYFPEEMGVEIIAEPGRFFATPTCMLVTSVHSIRKLEDEDFMYYINDGIYGSLNCVYRGTTILTPECLKDIEAEELFQCSIWGPTCDSSDKAFSNIMFPKLELGDRIVFRNAGAYTLSAGGTFNGFPLPKVIHVADQSGWSNLKNLLSVENFDDQQCADDFNDLSIILSSYEKL